MIIYLLAGLSAFTQQFYVRGEVRDESGNPLQNVSILVNRTGYVYRSGSMGTFGIISTQQRDTVTFTLDGYAMERLFVDANEYVNVRLKLLPSNTSNVRRDKLASLTRDMERLEHRKWFIGDESYATIIENRFVNAKKYPSTGMALNVDRASYSNIRRFINFNNIVPPDAVRIEEMLNYFNLNYELPEKDDVFKVNSVLTDCPWNPDNQLFFVDLSAKMINIDSLPPSNLVFLIDISGSMDMTNRLPLLKSAFRLLVNNLREKDTISIVVYGGVTGIMLNPTSGAEKEKILKAIDELTPGGSTPGESGIRVAYSVAKNQFIPGGNNRVILATDGDFNVGVKTEEELEELISQHRESGIYLTCLGVGMGNYKDSKIQTLARKGNGNFAYLDNFNEAEKVLLREFTRTLYTVADDVYMNVKFNPHFVREYRLIGYDNRVGALKDSTAVIEGGEIGSGHSMIAAFEISPVEKKNKGELRADYSGKYADVQIEFKIPNNNSKYLMNVACEYVYTPFYALNRNHRFATAVIMFGSLLKESTFTKNISWNEILDISGPAAIPGNPVQKEFISLVQQAKTMYSKIKKKKNKDTVVTMD